MALVILGSSGGVVWTTGRLSISRFPPRPPRGACCLSKKVGGYGLSSIRLAVRLTDTVCGENVTETVLGRQVPIITESFPFNAVGETSRSTQSKIHLIFHALLIQPICSPICSPKCSPPLLCSRRSSMLRPTTRSPNRTHYTSPTRRPIPCTT